MRYDNLLVVFRREQAGLAVVEGDVAGEFFLGEDRFQDERHGHLTGFYDWLRDHHGALVGVHFCPVESSEYLVDVVRSLEYVEVESDGQSFVARFMASPLQLSVSSHDQAFGGIVFVSNDGVFGISLDTTYVDPKDIDRLRSTSNTVWLEYRISLPLDGTA